MQQGLGSKVQALTVLPTDLLRILPRDLPSDLLGDALRNLHWDEVQALTDLRGNGLD